MRRRFLFLADPHTSMWVPLRGALVGLLLAGVGLLFGAATAQAQLPEHLVGETCSSCGPMAHETVDVDGDGDRDVVVASRRDGKIVWYENNGTGGGFTPHTITTSAGEPVSIDSGDLNGDGTPDILVAESSLDARRFNDEIAWYENDGGQWTKHTLATQDVKSPKAVRAADLDQDGDVDALSIHRDVTENRLAWYENDGTGSFSGQNVLSPNILYDDIRVADLDGDDDLDVVSSTIVPNSNDDQAVWFENQGDASFSSLKRIATEGILREVRVADIDGDETPDVFASVLATDLDKGGIRWYENDGTPSDGGWTSHLVSDALTAGTGGTVSQSIREGDVDDDGDLEIVVGKRGAAKAVFVFDSNGSPTDAGWAFEEAFRIDAPMGPGDISLADLNGDQRLDVLFRTRRLDYVVWSENEGMGDFGVPDPVTTVPNLTPRETVAADLNGDGAPDVFQSGDLLVRYENDGAGSLTPHPLVYRTVFDVDTADVDGDDDLDIVATTASLNVEDTDGDGNDEYAEAEQVLWFENEGTGELSRPKPLIVSKHPIRQVTSTDLDGDGQDEIFAASEVKSADFNGDGRRERGEGEVVGKVVTLHEYDGTATMTNQTLGIFRENTLVIPKDIATEDIDGNGEIDVVLFAGRRASWYKNEGETSFASEEKIVNGGFGMNVFDLDGDGTPGIFVSQLNSSDPYLGWYEADGSGNFPLQKEIPISASEVVFGDLNENGQVDLVTNGGITWSRNDGQENFSTRTVADQATGPLSLADVDGDGDSDVLGAKRDLFINDENVNGDVFAWYENRGLRIPAPPTSPTAQMVAPQRVPRGVEEVQLDWSASAATDVQEYAIYRETRLPLDSTRGPYFFDFAAIDTISASQTSYQDTDPLLQADTTYRYRITAIDDIQNESSFSGEVMATPRAPLSVHTVRPASGAPGTTLRIRGASFSSDPSAHTVTIGGVEAPVDSAKENVVYARVPAESQLPDDVEGPAEVTLETEGQTLSLPGAYTVVRGGSETFTASGADITPVESVRAATDWADYDNDGDLDLAVAGKNKDQDPSTTLYRNDDGSLTPIDAGLTDISGSAAWGDHNGDGRLDLLLTGFSGTKANVFLYQNESDGRFEKVLESEGRKEDGTGVTGIYGEGGWGDYDGDGDPDLFVAGLEEGDNVSSNSAQLYRNEEEAIFRWGSPTRSERFLPEKLFDNNAEARRLDWGDYNGDGLVDIVVAARLGVKVFRNEGDGTFKEIEVGDTFPDPCGVAKWGDYDNDGDLDIAAAGRGDTGPVTKIFQNKGGGTFEAIGANLTGVRRYSYPALDWGDFDGDGTLDLVVSGQTNDSGSRREYQTIIYRNEGGGTFASINAGVEGLVNASADWGDYDGDGDLDLLMTGNRQDPYEPVARLYRNEAPVAEETAVVTEGGTYDFGGTGVVLDVSGVSNFGEVTVQQFDWRTQDTTGVVGALASTDRFIMSPGDADFESVQVNVALSALGSLSNPVDVALYGRPEAGTGHFRALRTRLDENGTPDEASDDTLRAAADSLGEFVLGPDPYPTPPSGPSAEGGAKRVDLSWSASPSPDAATYRVYRNTAPIDSAAGPSGRVALDTTGASTTSYADTDVVQDTTYHYRVTAVDTTEYESVFSGEARATTVDQSPPDVPDTLVAEPSYDEVALTWSMADSADAIRYRIYRDTTAIDSAAGPSGRSPIDSTVFRDDTTYVDAEVGQDTTYHYRVTAVDTAANESGFSGEATATPGPLKIAFADGRAGAVYEPPSATPGTDQNPVGRLRLSAPQEGAELTALTIETAGATPEGIQWAELWRSMDATFEAGEDRRVYTAGSAAPATYSGLGISIPTDTAYFFVVLNLTEDASGEYEAVIQDEDSLAIANGDLARVNGSDGSSFTDAYLASGAAPLPVELASFEARTKEEAVRLQWTTASETGNAGFRVQRLSESAGEAESPEEETAESAGWTTIGSVGGSGTTSQPQDYRYTDEEIPYEADSLTYRLKQIDTDGTVQYSRSVTVERGVTEAELLGTYPNPASRRATIRYALPERQEVRVRLYDVLGRRVRTVVAGEKEGRHKQRLDVSGLSSGVYFLRLRAAGTVKTQRLTVVQ